MKKKTLAMIQPYVWLLPSVILMVSMILIPIVSVFKISFSDVGRSGIVRGLNGVQNYLDIFAEPIFWHTLQNTVIWTVVVVGVSTVFGFVLAMVLNQEFKTEVCPCGCYLSVGNSSYHPVGYMEVYY